MTQEIWIQIFCASQFVLDLFMVLMIINIAKIMKSYDMMFRIIDKAILLLDEDEES